MNEAVLYTQDGSRWEILIETSRHPNRSAKSVDGGQSWDYDHLGYNDCYDGEYLVRMEVDGYPAQGRITSPVFDLTTEMSGQELGQPFKLQRMYVEAQTDTPDGTSVEFELRAGSNPVYEPTRWSSWCPADDFVLRQDDRFVQWRAVLRTIDPMATPVLREVCVKVEVETEQTDWGRWMDAHNPPIRRPSHPFGYQAPSRRTRMLRERWNLDEVVQGSASDFDQIVCLMNWTREQWKDGWNPDWKALHYCPPWDAPLILEVGRHNLGRGMCTHYATVFVHACAALGIPARHVIHKAHCTAEAWSDYWEKWVWLDPGGDQNDETMAGYYVEQDGVPLSVLEAHAAWRHGKDAKLRLVGRHAEHVFRLQDRLALLDRFCIVLRNDQMTSLKPGEPEHGAVPYHYDGYLWWRDEQTPTLPWFSFSSNRMADFYWTLNRTRIYLQRTSERGVLRVMLASSMPNLAGLQVRLDNGEWEKSEPEFEWRLQSGENLLAARSTSAFGVEGLESWVRVGL
jgi:hypothetical protein